MDVLVQKTCRTCGTLKDLEKFDKFKKYDRPGQPVYFSSDCKACRSENARKRRYGTTLVEVLEVQGFLCALCQVEAATCLDHDHSTGKLRGAVCRRCNFALHYWDDPDWRKRLKAHLASGQ